MEDTQQPSNIDDLLSAPKPRTNPVNLIFVLSQYAPRVSETHFFPPRDFFDLFMRSNISSRSRATAFLWLMWWYLESDFSINAAEENPFGPGVRGSENEAPIKVPTLDIITDEQADGENLDTELEIEYGEAKRLERECRYPCLSCAVEDELTRVCSDCCQRHSCCIRLEERSEE